VYSLTRGTDYAATAPFYRNIAVGAPLDDHAYQFQLRIPKDVATEANVNLVNGLPFATLFLMPIWLTSGPSGVVRSALDARAATVGSVISRVSESAEMLVARLGIDTTDLASFLPTTTAGLVTGYHTFGPYSVYVYHLADLFDNRAPQAVDAAYLIGESSEEVATFQEAIDWAPETEWSRKSQDGFGLSRKVFTIIRTGISVTSQVVGKMLVPVMTLPAGSREQMTFGRSTFVVTKLTDFETGRPYFVVGETAVQTVKLRVPHPEIPGTELTEVRSIERGIRAEIVDNLEDSKLLTGVKYSSLKTALRGAAIGATLVVFGSQAVLAFADGDYVKGTVFSVAGGTAAFGVAKADVVFTGKLFKGRVSPFGFRVRLGTVATIAVTGILASYELYLAVRSTDSIKRLAHYESGASILADSIVAAVPLYGAAAMLGWQLGMIAAIGVEALLGIMPNSLAVKIVSSPGSTVVFLFEYAFTTEIPSAVAEDALIQLLNFLAEVARYSNSLNPPVPTLVLVP